MRVQFGESHFGSGTPLHFTTTYLVNDTVAIDAGNLGFMPLDRQCRVRHLFISHSHIDHIGSLPLFLESIYDAELDCPTIYGNASVYDCLQRDIFNGRIWSHPRLHTADPPLARFIQIEDGQSFTAEGLTLTAIAVNHTVPTLGYLVEDGNAAVVFAGDTGPTERLWMVANETPNLRAVFLEAAFPNSMQWLADVSKHLTPAMFALELRKLEKRVAIIAVHLKARFHYETAGELMALGLPLEIASANSKYLFE